MRKIQEPDNLFNEVLKKTIKLAGDFEFLPIWSDSMGVKTYSFMVITPDIKILVDPGCAAMQPSYPMPDEIKRRYRSHVLELLRRVSKEADVLVVTHYHYDHHVRAREAPEIYRGNLNLFKNPNFFINESQHRRAREFFKIIAEIFCIDFDSLLVTPQHVELSDPVESLKSSKLDFGDYNERRKELFRKGKKWLEKLFTIWNSEKGIREFKIEDTEFKFVDSKSFKFGETIVRFTPPLFHGIEYDRTGWVVGVVIESRGAKLVYTSDLQGPQIEDYADWIIRENPHVLIVDGPPTYLFGYMMNRINLNRAIRNMCRILNETDSRFIFYDHHLLRDPRYRERVREVYECAKRLGKRLLTYAEFFGSPPLVDILRDA